jgi:transketolase
MGIVTVDQKVVEQLKLTCRNIRRNIIRMIGEAGSGHPGSSLSGVEIAVTLYFHFMRINPTNPQWLNRDRFILSKGHASALLYAVLAERGYFSTDELMNYKKSNSKFGGHPDMNKVAGVDMTTGSLGQGLSVANGIALAGKYDHKDYHVYALLGDGETQEGQIWEAAMAASHYRLGNVTAFIDRNKLQIDGPTKSVMDVEPYADKWKGFGWNVIEIDGHNIEEIIHAVEKSKAQTDKPTAIIAHTVKGKGVSFMENQVKWHGVAPNKEQTLLALQELED